VGTFNPAFVKALLRARRLSSEGLSQGISRYKDAMGMKPGEQLNFNDIEVLSGIAKAGELWMSSNREALNNALQGLN